MEEQGVFRSRMSRWETGLALCWLPMHIFLLPFALMRLFPQLSNADLNLWVYVIGAAVLTLLCLRFLRRDFDRLCQQPGRVLLQVLAGYVLMLLGGDLAALLLGQLKGLLGEIENPNNAALAEMASYEQGKIAAISLFLAPLVEELIFRGGVYGLLRRRSKALAYGVCILLFSVYHTWQYALLDPVKWLYLLQYLPGAWALCRCYEKTETIWTPLLLHMFNNALTLWAMHLLGG